MLDRSSIFEEHFGILTDDELALDATLVRPAGLVDSDVLTVQVWVPKHPLTRNSVLPAARRCALVVDEYPWTVNLTFDLRGTGQSDGMPSPEGFAIDLHSIDEWARERFGPKINIQHFGFPEMGGANRLITMPLRAGVMMEMYRYHPSDGEGKASVLYFSHYNDFSRDDDAICREMADKGFIVYGVDLMRYLLLAGSIEVDALWEDSAILASQLDPPLYVIGRAFAAGPALLMAAGTQAVRGVILTGPAQEGLAAKHLFSPQDASRLALTQQVQKFSPRPAIFLWNQAESDKLDPASLKAVHDAADDPRLWAVVKDVDTAILLNALGWLAKRGG